MYKRQLRAAGNDLSNLTVVHVIRAESRAVYAEVLDDAAAAGARVERVVSPTGTLPDGTALRADGTALRAEGTHYFVSGAPQFVRATTSQIRRADTTTRLRPWRVHTDTFAGY